MSKKLIEARNRFINKEFQTKTVLTEVEGDIPANSLSNSTLVFANKDYSEKTDFIKIYINNRNLDICTILLELNKAGQRLLVTIWKTMLISHRDNITLNYEIYIHKAQIGGLAVMSMNDYTKAKNELISKDIIAVEINPLTMTKITNSYVINPNLFFKGDRLKLMTNLKNQYHGKG